MTALIPQPAAPSSLFCPHLSHRCRFTAGSSARQACMHARTHLRTQAARCIHPPFPIATYAPLAARMAAALSAPPLHIRRCSIGTSHRTRSRRQHQTTGAMKLAATPPPRQLGHLLVLSLCSSLALIAWYDDTNVGSGSGRPYWKRRRARFCSPATTTPTTPCL